MKYLLGYRQFLIVLLALALAQAACNFGGQPAAGTTSPQETPSGAEQATQPPPAATSERGTVDEAKAMLAKAVDHYNAVGRQQALADFTAKVAPFFDRDLYVVCMGADHIETANGGFPQYVGTSGDQLISVDGVPLGQAVWDALASSNEGSVSYHWVNPVNGKTEPKTLYFQKVGTDVCGVGVYTP